MPALWAKVFGHHCEFLAQKTMSEGLNLSLKNIFCPLLIVVIYLSLMLVLCLGVVVFLCIIHIKGHNLHRFVQGVAECTPRSGLLKDMIITIYVVYVSMSFLQNYIFSIVYP